MFFCKGLLIVFFSSNFSIHFFCNRYILKLIIIANLNTHTIHLIAMKPELKKLLILNAPYLLFVYLFDKIGQAVRLSPGADLSGKVLSLADGFSAAFANPLPSLAPMDLLIGIVGAVLIRLIVYVKGKNAKKYRKGIEYGSARWSA